MSNPIDLGQIGQGEQPLPLVHTFTYPDLSPLDLVGGGYSATWYARTADGQTQTKSPMVLDAGEVQVTWSADDFSVPGSGSAELWVISSSNRFRAVFVYTVQPSIG